jgi:hypothetical protein
MSDMTSRPGDRWPVLSAARKIARGGVDFVSPCTLKPLFQRPLNPHTALVADRLNAFSPGEGPWGFEGELNRPNAAHPLVRGLTREPGQR